MSKLITLTSRHIRRLLASAYPFRDPVFGRVDVQFGRAQYAVRFYYLISVFISYSMMPDISSLAGESNAWDFRWPVAWLSMFAGSRLIEWLPVALVFASLLTFQFPTYRAARVVFAILCLFVSALENSQGAMGHEFHFWVWIGICLVFLPSVQSSGTLPRTYKMTYLSVIVAVQALILVFYSLAGFWKVRYGLGPLLHGIEGNFAPRGLALQLADRMLETGTSPLLADFVITNYWLIWPMFLALMYIQLVAVLVVLRPRLHVVWGHLLILFHIGTWLLMEIEFTQNVLFLGLLFVMSPFRPREWNFREALSDLPGLGLPVRLFWSTNKDTSVGQPLPHSMA
jgi:hypothetical protein